MVDENRFEGEARFTGGKAQDALGGPQGEARGRAEQAAGAAQDAFGRARDALEDWSKSFVEFTKDKPVPALLIALSAGFVLRTLTKTTRR